MTQAYSDPARENEPHALPNVEVFRMYGDQYAPNGEPYEPGWYYWFCFPGCLPDSEPMGPFESYEEALDDAQRL